MVMGFVVCFLPARIPSWNVESRSWPRAYKVKTVSVSLSPFNLEGLLEMNHSTRLSTNRRRLMKP